MKKHPNEQSFSSSRADEELCVYVNVGPAVGRGWMGSWWECPRSALSQTPTSLPAAALRPQPWWAGTEDFCKWTVSQQLYSILNTNKHTGVANVCSRLVTPQLHLESFLARGSILPADNVPQLIQEGRQFQQTVPKASQKILGFMLKRISIKCLKNG